MSEQDLVRVEVTTAFFATPEQVNDPEWRTRLQGAQQALGALADSNAMTVDLSFNGVSEAEYDAEHAPSHPALARRQALEIASAGEGVLGQSMTSLLLEAGVQTEKASKILGGKLRNNGLDTVRAVCAVGLTHMTTYNEMSTYSPKNMKAILGAFAHKEMPLPIAPPVEHVALFCDSVDQVPGHVLFRIAKEEEANAYDKECEQARNNGTAMPDPDEDRFWLSARWRIDLLRRNVAELADMPLDKSYSVMMKRLPAVTLVQGPTREAAQALQRVARQYRGDFAAAKGAQAEAGTTA